MKSLLRKQLLEARQALSPGARQAQSQAIMRRLGTLAPFRSAHVVLAYSALPAEVDVAPLLLASLAQGKVVGLPRVDGPRLDPRRWIPTESLVRGRFGVWEPAPSATPLAPESLDLVLVPGVGFDHEGHRLGFGQGFYDRFLATLPTAFRVGLAFREQVVPQLPVTSKDIGMDWVVTPDEVHRANTPRT